MKKLVLLSSFLFMITSCHNEGTEDVSSLEKNSNITASKTAQKKTSNNTIVTLSMDPVTPLCYNSILDNRNVQLHISQPAPYDIQFKLTLKQKALGGYLSVPNPWVMVIIPKGETWATLDTACQLESFISCGKYTEIKTANFRLTVTSAKYFSAPGETFNYEFNNGVNTYDFAHQVSCLGGGWNPDEPK